MARFGHLGALHGQCTSGTRVMEYELELLKLKNEWSGMHLAELNPVAIECVSFMQMKNKEQKAECCHWVGWQDECKKASKAKC